MPTGFGSQLLGPYWRNDSQPGGENPGGFLFKFGALHVGAVQYTGNQPNCQSSTAELLVIYTLPWNVPCMSSGDDFNQDRFRLTLLNTSLDFAGAAELWWSRCKFNMEKLFLMYLVHSSARQNSASTSYHFALWWSRCKLNLTKLNCILCLYSNAKSKNRVAVKRASSDNVSPSCGAPTWTCPETWVTTGCALSSTSCSVSALGPFTSKLATSFQLSWYLKLWTLNPLLSAIHKYCWRELARRLKVVSFFYKSFMSRSHGSD